MKTKLKVKYIMKCISLSAFLKRKISGVGTSLKLAKLKNTINMLINNVLWKLTNRLIVVDKICINCG